jgi:uncharacterized protein (TIGR00251 family)
MVPFEEKQGFILLRVRVQPKASRNALTVEPDGRIRVALTAPPVEGAANKALVQFMAAKLGVAKSSVTVTAGQKSRDKTVKVVGIAAAEVRVMLDLQEG